MTCRKSEHQSKWKTLVEIEENGPWQDSSLQSLSGNSNSRKLEPNWWIMQFVEIKVDTLKNSSSYRSHEVVQQSTTGGDVAVFSLFHSLSFRTGWLYIYFPPLFDLEKAIAYHSFLFFFGFKIFLQNERITEHPLKVIIPSYLPEDVYSINFSFPELRPHNNLHHHHKINCTKS